MYFRESTNWYVNESYDPTEPFSFWENNPDLESYALHELGHSQLLLHSNNQDDIMWHEVVIPKRSPEPYDKEGAEYILDISTVYEPNCNVTPVSLLTDCDFTNTYTPLEEQNTIQVFPNPTEGILNIQSEKYIDDFILIDAIGNEIFRKKSHQKSHQYHLENLPSGIYFIVIRSGNYNYTGKIEKL
jgi:hypothetical protein